VEHRLNEHIKAVNFVKSILPVSRINIEAAAFDIQKIKNPDISGVGYQNGEAKNFWNVREYVLYRDGHRCSHCGKSDAVLNVHHIKSRQTGGNSPDNLITLCETCHKAYHKGKIGLKINKLKRFKAETIMSILRWKIVNRLRELGNTVSVTYGYLTKSARIALKLDKSHANDAYVIAGGAGLGRTDVIGCSFTRRNNRSIQLNRKGFAPSVRRKRYPLQPNDIVRYGKLVLRVVGTHSYGKVVRLRDEFKNKIDISVKKAKLLTFGKGLRFT
jgi:N6-L-threonylcarbamoyladenine synthase